MVVVVVVVVVVVLCSTRSSQGGKVPLGAWLREPRAAPSRQRELVHVVEVVDAEVAALLDGRVPTEHPAGHALVDARPCPSW